MSTSVDVLDRSDDASGTKEVPRAGACPDPIHVRLRPEAHPPGRPPLLTPTTRRTRTRTGARTRRACLVRPKSARSGSQREEGPAQLAPQAARPRAGVTGRAAARPRNA